MGVGAQRSEGLKGARFGAHEIVRLIGHGATASVFEAQHLVLGKSVAIKLLHEHLASNEQIAGRFVREGRVAGRLRHPNAIDVIDVGVEDGAPYLVMELLRGIDLRTLLVDTAPIDVEPALAYLLPIASALQHAHDAGVLHRDLKPANIFLARDLRDDVVPKLVDFGLSKVSEGDEESALTRSELVAGTALYMAPEQTLGVRHASPRSDQYALAAVLYECLTGAPPFASEGTLFEVMERVRSSSPPPPSVVNVGLPPAIDAVVLRAMERDPSARFDDVRAFGAALLPFADATTREAFARDFEDRPANRDTGASRSSVHRSRLVAPSSASAETRAEMPVEKRAASSASTSAGRAAPPLPCPPGASPFHIKGVFYKGLILQVSTTVGLDELCAALPDDALRAFVRQPFLASTRYDVLPFFPITHTLARLVGVPFEKLLRTSTIAQVHYDAKHVYKRIFDSRRPEDVAERIGRFNSQIYDFGSYSGRMIEPKRIAITFENIPAYLEPWIGPMHLVYAEESLRIAGGADVTVVSTRSESAGVLDGFPLISIRTELRWR